ncbi:MAG: hypothetical protein SOR72_00830 [Hornefia sp.]|nr:hypothetical protein [Hornefia sp.]
MKFKCSLCGTLCCGTSFKSGAICSSCLDLIKQHNFDNYTEVANPIR